MTQQLDPTPTESGSTGRYLVVFHPDAHDHGRKLLAQTLGVQVRDARELAGAKHEIHRHDVYFAGLGAAVVRPPPDAIHALSRTSDARKALSAVEPERYVFALGKSRVRRAASKNAPPDYLRGYRDALQHLNQILEDQHASVGGELVEAHSSASAAAWNLDAVRACQSPFTGKGVKVAVLDTGFGPHADFERHEPTSASFVGGPSGLDGHGHGTHCAGVIGGPKETIYGQRYGIAPEATLFAGKVLTDGGDGADAAILAGMEWALEQGVDLISLSVGSLIGPGEGYNEVYEQLGQRALKRGCLIIAAAGNENGAPVVSPANCPSIFAVGALNALMQPAFFTNRGVNGHGGEVNVAAPGVSILSSWPRPPEFRSLQGTSMAAPQVTGVAALWIEKTGARGEALWHLLEETAKPLSAPRELVGAGLVQAPV